MTSHPHKNPWKPRGSKTPQQMQKGLGVGDSWGLESWSPPLLTVSTQLGVKSIPASRKTKQQNAVKISGFDVLGFSVISELLFRNPKLDLWQLKPSTFEMPKLRIILFFYCPKTNKKNPLEGNQWHTFRLRIRRMSWFVFCQLDTS